VKYLLIIHMNPEAFEGLSEEERQAIGAAHGPYIADLKASGEFITTVALADPSNSRVVRVRDGAPAVTDGPYLEAKEYLAGYYLIDCESDERANEIAARMPDAAYQGVEVRPVMFEDGMEM
jgi:hypothetical protein